MVYWLRRVPRYRASKSCNMSCRPTFTAGCCASERADDCAASSPSAGRSRVNTADDRAPVTLGARPPFQAGRRPSRSPSERATPWERVRPMCSSSAQRASRSPEEPLARWADARAERSSAPQGVALGWENWCPFGAGRNRRRPRGTGIVRAQSRSGRRAPLYTTPSGLIAYLATRPQGSRCAATLGYPTIALRAISRT